MAGMEVEAVSVMRGIASSLATGIEIWVVR